MERKAYILENLCCANCAAKIEEKFNRHPQVSEAVITFTTRQLRLTAETPDALIPELQHIARGIEPDVIIRPREERKPHQEQAGCTCGHDHHEHEECGCGHDHHGHKKCGCGHDHHGHEECGCGHDHHGHKECGCGHDHHGQEECSCGHDHHGHKECGCGHDHHGHKECGCGHDHHAHGHEGCGCGHEHHHAHDAEAVSREKWDILKGVLLFAAGIGLNASGLPALAVPAFFLAYGILGWEIIATAWKNLTRGNVFDENFLMSIATIGAFCIGEFPEAVGVMLFYRIGEYFEHRAVERSRSQIMDALDLRPEVVNRIEGDEIQVIPAEQAAPGDLLLVRPGDRIPLDGTVVSGESRVDTAAITGESVPVYVARGDSVISGCVNTQGQLTIRVEKNLAESMVTRILDSVENAAASKPKIDRFISRFARIYTPIVVLAAVLTAVVPSLVTGNWSYWVYTALTFLVMSCPCALVLSVPLAFFSGIGVGSKKGILFKGGQSMEALCGIKTVVMDKTGTITKGEFRVQKVEGTPGLLALCASAEQQSSHPIAASITAAAREQGLTLIRPDTLEEIPGKGIRAIVDGKEILCGNEGLLEDHGIFFTLPETYGTRVLAAVDGSYAGYILIADTIKPDAEAAVARLKAQGILPVMLTGDEVHSARAVAQQVGIDQVYARLLPQEKLETLRSIRGTQGAAMFVGDGINDAPVLAGADVGAAMGSGADAAIEAADVVFMTSSMAAIPQALDIAAQTRRIAWQNVAFALAVKAVVMVLGLFGYASMWLAVFADSGVAMLCVLNAIRMLYKK